MIAPDVQYPQHRYFVLRSSCEVDIETSNAHGVWVSSPNVNTMLNNAYLKRIGQIFLIFSVIKRYDLSIASTSLVTNGELVASSAGLLR